MSTFLPLKYLFLIQLEHDVCKICSASKRPINNLKTNKQTKRIQLKMLYSASLLRNEILPDTEST